MKKILSTIIAFTVCLSMSGQQISQSNNRYRGNDALEKKQVTVKGFDLNSKVVARVHGHGSWDKDYVNSAGDGNEIFSESDKKVYQRLQIYGYVSTPKGKMLKWDPNDRTSIIISDKMPKDPKTVNKNERFIKSYKHSKESSFQKRRDEWYRKKSQESLINKLLSIIIKGK